MISASVWSTQVVSKTHWIVFSFLSPGKNYWKQQKFYRQILLPRLLWKPQSVEYTNSRQTQLNKAQGVVIYYGLWTVWIANIKRILQFSKIFFFKLGIKCKWKNEHLILYLLLTLVSRSAYSLVGPLACWVGSKSLSDVPHFLFYPAIDEQVTQARRQGCLSAGSQVGVLCPGQWASTPPQ